MRAIALATTSKDISWDKAPNAALGSVEANLGIICCSVVTLGPLFRLYAPSAWLDRLGRADRLKLGRITLTKDSPGSGNTAIGADIDLEAVGRGKAGSDGEHVGKC